MTITAKNLVPERGDCSGNVNDNSISSNIICNSDSDRDSFSYKTWKLTGIVIVIILPTKIVKVTLAEKVTITETRPVTLVRYW